MQMNVSQEVCEQMQRPGIKIAFSQRVRKTKKTNAELYLISHPINMLFMR